MSVALYSLLERVPDANITVIVGGVSEASVRVFKATFPGVAMANATSLDFGARESHQERASQKLFYWKALFDLLGDEEVGLFFDADVLFLDSVEEDLNFAGDLLLTLRPHRWPLNTGIIAAKKSPYAEKIFSSWLDKTVAIMSDPIQSRLAAEKHGACDQASLVEILQSEGIDIGGFSSLSDSDFLSGRFSFAPASRLNEVRSIPIGESLKIIHFKTAWHPILFRESTFYHGRPRETSQEMYDAWREVYRRYLLDEAEAIEARVTELAVNLQLEDLENSPRGILPSELAFFAASVFFLDVQCVIETGRAEGVSTEYLSRVLARKKVDFYSVELGNDEVSPSRWQRIHRNVPSEHFLFGDARVVVPTLLAKLKASRVAVLIDGPKGTRAISFARELATQKNVFALGLHDLRKIVDGKPSSFRNAFENIFDCIIFSDKYQVFSQLSFMDGGHYNLQPTRNYNARFTPHYKGREYMDSYGPTLGVAIVGSSDRFREAARKAPLETKGMSGTWLQKSHAIRIIFALKKRLSLLKRVINRPG